MNRRNQPAFRWPEIPRQWPSALFCICILCLCGALLVSHATISDYICQSGEGIAVCSRNWLSAAGNLLTGAVAFVAALFAYNQYVANARQADLGTIPYIEKNISDLKRIHALVVIAIRSQILLQGNVNNFFFLLEQAPDENILRERAQPIEGLGTALQEARTSLLEASADLSLPPKIREIADDQAELCAIRTHDQLQMLNYLIRFAEKKIRLQSSDMRLVH